MHKMIKYFVPFFFLIHLSFANAEIDPRMKALGTMAAYGTVGGALLGTASLAFGTSGRSVAQGASLGLYAGILFGSYVVLSHYTKTRPSKSSGDYYPEAPPSPYEEEAEPGAYEEFDGGADGTQGAGSPFRIQQFLIESDTRRLYDPFRPTQSIPYFLNFININF